MSDRHCWRCNRRLEIEEPPKEEAVILPCPRCRAKNVVQLGQATQPRIDNVSTPVQQYA